MKKLIKLTFVLFFTFGSLVLLAQSPPHPNGGNAPGGGNTPVGGGAPIDGGLTIMMMLGAVYAIKKKIYIQK
jgi:hypothetical protein